MTLTVAIGTSVIFSPLLRYFAVCSSSLNNRSRNDGYISSNRMWFDIVPQLRCGGSGASRLDAVARDERLLEDGDDRFFLAAMRSLSGPPGGEAPTAWSACLPAGTFYSGHLVGPRLRLAGAVA